MPAFTNPRQSDLRTPESAEEAGRQLHARLLASARVAVASESFADVLLDMADEDAVPPPHYLA